MQLLLLLLLLLRPLLRPLRQHGNQVQRALLCRVNTVADLELLRKKNKTKN